MDRLTARERRRFLDVVAGLHARRDLRAFPEHVLSRVPALLPVDAVAWYEVDVARPRTRYVMVPAGRAAFVRHLRGHRLEGRGARGRPGPGGRGLAGRRDLPPHALLSPLAGPPPGAHRVSVGVTVPGSGAVGLVLWRRGPGFSARERRLVALLRPHLLRAYRSAATAPAARPGLGLAVEPPEASRAGALVIDGRGRIEGLSAQARAWVEAYFGPVRAGRPPRRLAAWLGSRNGGRPGSPGGPDLVRERGSRRLVARLLAHGRRTFVLLHEERTAVERPALGRLGLSARELEVLAWVVEGKTNPEIATILGLSPRTVGNHLARIYARLGVETRTAAARVALTAP